MNSSTASNNKLVEESFKLSEYVLDLANKIQSNTSYPIPYQNYLLAQLYFHLGDNIQALQLAHLAYESMQSMKSTFEWEGVYYNICGLLATLYDNLNDINQTEKYFKEVIHLNENGIYIGEYAFFLHRRKRDFINAKTYYLKSLELYPKHSSIHLKYAGFLRHVTKNLNEAEKHYILACQHNELNADALGGYASFLHGVIGNMEKAEIFYEKAITADSYHANNLCNFGLFLSEQKKDYVKAEKMYKAVSEFNETHINTLYNFAVMLDTQCKRKTEAEILYRKCIAVEANHAYSLYNLAVLLEEKVSEEKVNQDSLLEIKDYYRRAMESDLSDPVTTSDYGRFLLLKMNDPENAKLVLETALDIDNNCESALYHLSLLFHQFHIDLPLAEKFYRKLLTINPNHLNGCQHFTSLLVDNVSKMKSESKVELKTLEDLIDEIMNLFERMIVLSKDDAMIVDYLNFAIEFGNKKHKLHVISYISSASTISNDNVSKREVKGLLETLQTSLKTTK